MLKYVMSYMVKLHCWWREFLSMEQKIVIKDFLDRFEPNIYQTLIKS